MNTMLTAKDVQQLLNVDRSTVYRMAEDGRLPAVKIGKQWRFPADRIEEWLGIEVNEGSLREPGLLESPPKQARENTELSGMLPLECVQMIQDSHADLLGVMMVITDLEGNPITQPSNPCNLFKVVSEEPQAIKRCISSWHDLGQSLNIEPEFQKSSLGLLCARGLIRVGKELPGMVVVGCIAPDAWPPNDQEVSEIAVEFGVKPELLLGRLSQVYRLGEEQRATVLSTVQRVANIVAHIVQERQVLLGRLNGIANLAQL